MFCLSGNTSVHSGDRFAPKGISVNYIIVLNKTLKSRVYTQTHFLSQRNK